MTSPVQAVPIAVDGPTRAELLGRLIVFLTFLIALFVAPFALLLVVVERMT